MFGLKKSKNQINATGESEKKREPAPGVWLDNNLMNLPKELNGIVDIYKSGHRPHEEELLNFTNDFLGILLKLGAFPKNHDEKERIFQLMLNRVLQDDLVSFYGAYAHRSRSFESHIARKIIHSIKNGNGLRKEDIHLPDVTHEGDLYFFLKLNVKDKDKKNESAPLTIVAPNLPQGKELKENTAS